MPARRRTSPVPAVRRPKVAGTTPAGRPEGDGDGPTLTGVRTPRPVAAGRSARARTEPAGAEPVGPLEDPLADGPAAADAAAPGTAAPDSADTAATDTADTGTADTDTASTGTAAPGTADTDTAATDTAATDTAATDTADTEAVGTDAAAPGTGTSAPADLTKRPAGPDTDDGTPAVPRGRRRLRPGAPDDGAAATSRPGLPARLRTVPVLAGALVVLVALAAFFGIATASMRGTPAAANSALTDLAATSEVSTQLGDALEVLYSYDFARLDENERAARDVITEGFTPEFERLFTQVRDLAPQQQAVVSAVVSVSAVQSIEGDRAVLVAFMDQQATTAASAEQVAAAGRLTVTGEFVDGRWKIAAVESR